MLTNFVPNPLNGLQYQTQFTEKSIVSNSYENLSPMQKERVIKAERALAQNHPAEVIYDRVDEIAKALLNQNEASVTLPGKIADKIYRFVGSIFKRNVQESFQEPIETPQDNPDVPLQVETPITKNPSSADLQDGFYCSSRIFKYDLVAGTTSLQLYVPRWLDCECAGMNGLYQAQLKLIYISDSQPTSTREYRFTAHNITAIFTADRFLPKQLTDIIPDKMPEILADIDQRCTIDQYKTTRIIVGCVVGGAGLLFIAGIALYVNRANLKKCNDSRC